MLKLRVLTDSLLDSGSEGHSTGMSGLQADYLVLFPTLYFAFCSPHQVTPLTATTALDFTLSPGSPVFLLFHLP